MLMKTLLFLVLTPVLVFGQISKEKYALTDGTVFSETTVVNQCNFSHWKVALIYSGEGQKIDSDKGRYANERLKGCNLKTSKANWTVGSTEIKFEDKNGNVYWLFLDNDKLNFHDWSSKKEYFLYLKVLEGPDRLIFLDGIEGRANGG